MNHRQVIRAVSIERVRSSMFPGSSMLKRRMVVQCSSMVVLLTVLGLNTAQAQWSSAQRVLGASAVLLTGIDAFLAIDARDQGFRELNPLLGAHPSDARVVGYTVGATAVGLTVAAVLPSKARTPFLVGWTAWELAIVQHQWRLGIRPVRDVDWEEVADGVGANLLLRLLPKPYRGIVPRALIFLAVSGLWEFTGLDRAHPGNLGQAREDYAWRLAGYAFTEVMVLGFRVR